MPFNNRLDCPKCGYTRFDWQFETVTQFDRRNDYEVLHVTCKSCGWKTEMEPKDA